MKMNRRNALLGLGAIATGGGALFGSGAFSTVTAERSVTLSSTGDASANLQMTVSNANVATTASDGEIAIDASGFNVNSTTVYEAVITITNTGNNSVWVAADAISAISGFDNVLLRAYQSQNDNITADYDLDTTAVLLGSGGDLVVGLVAVATDGTTGSGSDTITIEASDDKTWESSVSPSSYSGNTES